MIVLLLCFIPFHVNKFQKTSPTYKTNYIELISQHLTSNTHNIEGHKSGWILLMGVFFYFSGSILLPFIPHSFRRTGPRLLQTS